MSHEESQFTILLVEDEENDVMLIKRALKKTFITNPIYVANNGQEAIDYLSGQGPFAARAKFPFPDVVITDLKMPKKTGFELLGWMNEHPEFKVIPTIVLSSSKQDLDVARSYNLGANTYMVKPADFETLAQMIKLIRDYWGMSVKPNPTHSDFARRPSPLEN